MKTSLQTITVALIAAFAFVSCKTTPEPPKHDHSTHSHAAAPAKTPTAEPKTASPSIKPYPLKTCIVSDEDLESMGGSITKVYGNQEVKFCCKGCVKEFEASKAEFLAKLP